MIQKFLDNNGTWGPSTLPNINDQEKYNFTIINGMSSCLGYHSYTSKYTGLGRIAMFTILFPIHTNFYISLRKRLLQKELRPEHLDKRYYSFVTMASCQIVRGMLEIANLWVVNAILDVLSTLRYIYLQSTKKIS